jgi:predicted RNA-binding protein YlqC (UPF0109 family)
LSEDLRVDQLAELVTFMARALVDEPEQVKVEAIEDDRAVVLELTVAPDDLGKVIGRDGRTARAMRTLLAATSARQRRRAVLEILE